MQGPLNTISISYATFSIELTKAKANEDDDAEYYFEKAFSAEYGWGYYEDMHCGKLMEFATSEKLVLGNMLNT